MCLPSLDLEVGSTRGMCLQTLDLKAGYVSTSSRPGAGGGGGGGVT